MIHKIAFFIVVVVLGCVMQALSEGVVASRVVPMDNEVRVVPLTNSVPEVVWPAALAPAYREFAAKCAAGTATRGDLIALKKFIAASAVDAEAKTNATKRVRKIYQESKKRK